MEKKVDLRITRTHHMLRTAFTQMMEEKRFEDITVNDLCERAMIRRTTFYKHFSDKYDFFNFYLIQIRNDFQNISKSFDEHEYTFSYFIGMTQELIRFLNEHEKMVHRIFESHALPTLLDMICELIVKDIREKIEEDSCNGQTFSAPPDILSSFYVGGLLQTLRWWFTQKERMPEQKLVNAIKNIVCQGDRSINTFTG